MYEILQKSLEAHQEINEKLRVQLQEEVHRGKIRELEIENDSARHRKLVDGLKCEISSLKTEIQDSISKEQYAHDFENCKAFQLKLLVAYNC